MILIVNVYQMYVANGNKAGFLVRRNSWANTYAQVRSIAGQAEGKLPGRAPYFGNPTVLVDMFAMDGTLRSANQVLKCPGTFTYTWITFAE